MSETRGPVFSSLQQCTHIPGDFEALLAFFPPFSSGLSSEDSQILQKALKTQRCQVWVSLQLAGGPLNTVGTGVRAYGGNKTQRWLLGGLQVGGSHAGAMQANRVLKKKLNSTRVHSGSITLDSGVWDPGMDNFKIFSKYSKLQLRPRLRTSAVYNTQPYKCYVKLTLGGWLWVPGGNGDALGRLFGWEVTSKRSCKEVKPGHTICDSILITTIPLTESFRALSHTPIISPFLHTIWHAFDR